MNQWSLLIMYKWILMGKTFTHLISAVELLHANEAVQDTILSQASGVLF